MDNGQQASPAERRRTAPANGTGGNGEGETARAVPASRAAPTAAAAEVVAAPAETVATHPLPASEVRTGGAVEIAPLGEFAVFGTSAKGYTLFHMLNRGDGEAEVTLTWMGRNGAEIAQIFTNRPGGAEYYRDLFAGAKVAITNLSQRSPVLIRTTLCP